MLRTCAQLFVLFACVATARADTLTLRGSTIPLRGCTIQDVKSGRLYYLDARGRRQWRELDEVGALGFEGLVALDAAETALAEGRTEEGLRGLLRALLDAETEIQQLWLRVRLVTVHEQRNEHVQAAGHVAVVFRLRDDPAWRDLAPDLTEEPVDAPFSVLHEALAEIDAAGRSVRSPELRDRLRGLRRLIEPAHERARAAWEGPVPADGSTLSGIPIERLRGDGEDMPSLPEPTKPTPAPITPPSRATEPVPAPAPPKQEPTARRSSPSASADGSERIDELLELGRSAEALALCERAAADPGQRRLSQFLFQYGRCLAAERRPRDAVVMYLRCAVLYESSAFAPPSLVEAARIHREVWGDTAAARRLLEQAVVTATVLKRADDAERAERMLRSLPAPPGDE